MARPRSWIWLLGLTLLCVLFAGSIQAQMTDAVSRCLTVIIPSLYAMMILSRLLIASGAWQVLGRPLKGISQMLLRMPQGCAALFFVSQFAGYPVGAGMLRMLYEQGALNRADARRLLCVCYGGGPAFLLALLGAHPRRMALVGLVCGSQILANLLLAQLLFRRHPIALTPAAATDPAPISAQQLIDSTAQAGKSLLGLCGMILCCAAGCAVLERLGLFWGLDWLGEKCGCPISLAPVAQSLLEVSMAAQLSLPLELRVPLLTGLLSFGGICVICQVCAAAGTIFPGWRFLGWRFLAGVLSGGLCWVGIRLWHLDSGAAIATAAPYQVAHDNWFPVCMLVVMMGMVCWEHEREQRS